MGVGRSLEELALSDDQLASVTAAFTFGLPPLRHATRDNIKAR